MKKLYIVGALLALSLNAHGATVALRNSNTAFTSVRPITNTGNIPIADGTGFVATGFFTLPDATLQMAASSPATFAQVAADFAQFGASTKFGGASAFNISGLYIAEPQETITSAIDPRVGRTLYTIIGNGETFGGSTEIAIVKHTTSVAEGPTFTTNANVATDGASVLVGNAGIGQVDVGAGPVSALGLVAVVPEPSSALLGVLSLAIMLRRKR